MEEAKERLVNPKMFIVLVGLILVWLVFIAFIPPEFKPTEREEGILVTFKANADGRTILNKTLEVETGTNAFEAMMEAADVGYQDFGEMGVMVESIEGTEPGENEFWSLYVDGEMAMTGISGITLEKNTTIEWKIDAIEDYLG